MNLPFIGRNDIDPFEEHGLYGGLPRPEAQRIIRKRRVIRIEHEGGAALQASARILLHTAKLRGAFDQFGFEHVSCALPDEFDGSICDQKRQAYYTPQIHSLQQESRRQFALMGQSRR